MIIRYFVQVSDNGEPDIIEIRESAFVELVQDTCYHIEYERHTVRENGCNQVCLTVNTEYTLDIDELATIDIIEG